MLSKNWVSPHFSWVCHCSYPLLLTKKKILKARIKFTFYAYLILYLFYTYFTLYTYQEFFWKDTPHLRKPRVSGRTVQCEIHPESSEEKKIKNPGIIGDISMPFLLCLKKKKSPEPLGRSIFQRHTPPVQQNYQALLESCLRNKRLFTDDAFPAHISSIGTGALLKKLPQNLQWKRPHVSDFQSVLCVRGWLQVIASK